MMKRFLAACAATAAATLWAGTAILSVPARAQMDNGLPGPQPIDMGSVILSNTLLKIRMDNNASSRGKRKKRFATKRITVGASGSTKFHTSPLVTARARQQFVDWIGKTDGPKAAAAISAELVKKDYIAEWARQMGKDGLKRGDVADALTAYFVQNWQIANNVMETSTAQVQGALKQMRPLLATNPSLTRLTDAQKQEIAETFVYNQLIQGSVYGEAAKQNNAVLKQKASDAAVARFQNEMHINLRQLTLTPRGFIKRG